MPQYDITAPDGRKFRVEAPEGASEQDIMSYVRANADKAETPAAPKRERTGNIAAGLEGAAQGVTFGFSDELEGLGRAVYSMITEGKGFGEGYDEGVSAPRERIKGAKETNPVAFYGGEIGGGIAVPGGLARIGIAGPLAASAGRGLAARSVAGAKEGAAYGAAFGAGTAEGGVGDRLSGAVEGTVAGGAFGAAAPGAIDLASAVGKRIATPVRAALQPNQVAHEKVAEAFARDMGEAGAGAAVHRLEGKMANAAVSDAAGSANLMVADFGGENVRNLARAAANMPNEQAQKLKRTLDQRQSTQWKRIESDLASTLGPTHNFYATVDNLAKRMDDIGRRHIQASFAVSTPMTPALKSVFDRPTMKEVGEQVARRFADEGRDGTKATLTELIHRSKMELDDQIGIAKRAEKMGNKPQAGWDARTLQVLKNDLLNATQNDHYKRGLKFYAGEARLKNAAEEGFEQFTKMPIETMQKTIRGFDTDHERSMFRLGAARAIVDQVRRGNMLRDRTENVFASPDMQLRMQVIFPNNASRREFQKSLVIEAKMADTRKAVQGNSTTAKQLMQAGEAGQAVETGRSILGAMTGKLEPILNLISRTANRFSGITPETADEILKVMMQKDLGQMRPAIEKAMIEAAQTPAQRAALASHFAGGAAAATTDTPRKPKTFEDALRLPKGTRFTDPAGVERVR